MIHRNKINKLLRKVLTLHNFRTISKALATNKNINLPNLSKVIHDSIHIIDYKPTMI